MLEWEQVMPMNRFDTVLFDLDGTLVDSNEVIIRSYAHAFSTVLPDVFVSREDIIRQIGPPLHAIFGRYTHEADIVEKLVQTYRRHYVEHETGLTRPYPDVETVLHTLAEADVQTAIVTTKLAEAAWPVIRRYGFDDCIDTFVFLDDVSCPKPDPEPVFLALSRFGRVGEAVMVGDNQGDLLAARNAGIACAGVAWSIKGEAHLAEVEPDIMLRSMKDLLDYVDFSGKEL